MNPDPAILVIRGGAIGDFILTLPTLGALRERWPRARIEILGYPHIAELARGRHYADAVRSIAHGPMSGFFIPNSVLDPELMEYFARFDLIISYFFDPDELFARNLRRCGVKRLVTASAKPGERHATEHFARPLTELSVQAQNFEPRIFPSAEDKNAAAELLRGCQNPVAIHPGSGSERKNWPLAQWKELCDWLRREQQRDILLVVGEADRTAKEMLKPFAARVVENLSLPVLGAVISRCAFFVGNDSGITHLAAASGAPTLALFVVTDPVIWRPRGKRVRVLYCGSEWSENADRPGTKSDIPQALVRKAASEMLAAGGGFDDSRFGV